MLEKTFTCLFCKKKFHYDKKTHHLCQESSSYSEYNKFLLNYDLKKAYEFKDMFNTLEGKENIFLFSPILPYRKPFQTLNEGITKTSKLNHKGNIKENIIIKHEEANPSGSFKDRSSVICINEALREKRKRVTIASQGDQAISLALYALQFDIGCVVFMPEKSDSVVKQTLKLLGCHVILIAGATYEETFELHNKIFNNVVKYSKQYYNYNTNHFSYGLEGYKTIAFEIFAELKIVPDYVIVPARNGTLFTGIWKGFDELRKMKITQDVPKMVAVQIEKFSPIFNGFVTEKHPQTIDSVPNNNYSLSAQKSYDYFTAIHTIEKSKGRVIVVGETEIKKTMYDLSEGTIKTNSDEKIDSDPSSSIIFSVVEKLAGRIKDNKVAVLVNTASIDKTIALRKATKKPKEIFELLIMPNDYNECLKILHQNELI